MKLNLLPQTIQDMCQECASFWVNGKFKRIFWSGAGKIGVWVYIYNYNTPGIKVGPGGSDQMLAVKRISKKMGPKH